MEEDNAEAIALQQALDLSLQLQEHAINSSHSPASQLRSNEKVLEEEEGLENVIIVDNLPLVRPEKFKKLKSVVSKVFGAFGVIKEEMFYMPVDSESGHTLGYCFMEFNSPQKAELAKRKIDGSTLGKDTRYKLSVTSFNVFDRIMNVPDQWTPPKMEAYVCGENLQNWSTDDKGRDQFLIHAGFDLEISWNDPVQLKAEVVHHLDERIEGFLLWSPLGTYLATVDKQGVHVWGGATTFKCLVHCTHPEVKLIDFSPAEKYVVTYGCHEPETPLKEYNVVLKFFDVRTGKVKKSFEGSAKDFGIRGNEGTSSVSWPLIRWSSDKDDKYFALIGRKAIHIYEAQDYSFKKLLRIEDVKDFSWSPADLIIGVFVPELDSGNQPARVSLIKIPDKQVLRQKSLFNVCDCKMYWQSNGNYLAIKVERWYSKTKKITYSGLELFNMGVRYIPVEALELENKNDEIFMFAWEPKGERFAVIHGDNRRPDISFYSMKNASNIGIATKVTTLKGRQANAVYWSPAGRFVVFAGLNDSDGQLEFYDVDELKTTTMTEHYMVTNIEWDPTGRYVATSATAAHAIDNDINIWSFHGKLLYKMTRDDLSQFSWRPRPPALLSDAKEEEIKKNLKNYSKKYKAEEQDVSKYFNEQEQQRRKMLMEEWSRWVSEWKPLHQEEKVQRLMLRDEEDSEEEETYSAEEVEYEELLNSVEEIIDFHYQE